MPINPWILRGYMPKPFRFMPGRLLITCSTKQITTILKIAKRVLVSNDSVVGLVAI